MLSEFSELTNRFRSDRLLLCWDFDDWDHRSSPTTPRGTGSGLWDEDSESQSFDRKTTRENLSLTLGGAGAATAFFFAGGAAFFGAGFEAELVDFLTGVGAFFFEAFAAALLA